MMWMDLGQQSDDAIPSTKIWAYYAVYLGQITCEIYAYALP